MSAIAFTSIVIVIICDSSISCLTLYSSALALEALNAKLQKK